MISIQLPEIDFNVEVNGLEVPAVNDKGKNDMFYSILSKQIPWKSCGVYIIYDQEGTVYIGRSINLTQRICSHLVGSEASTKSSISNIVGVKGFFVDDICDQEIYEAYAIKTLAPRCNKAKTERIRNNYRV